MERVKVLLKSGRPAKWIFYGDSITHGAVHTFGWRDYTELFTERVRYELGRMMDVVIKTAISGDNSRGLLETFDWRIGQFAPDAVFIMIGMNDCSEQQIPPDEFAGNLHALVEKIAALGGHPVLQTTCPILPGTAPDREPYFPRYMEIVRTVAKERRLPLVDHARYWEENSDKLYYWMSNGFHPNEFGHRAFASLLFREMGISEPAGSTCKLFFP